MSGRPYSATKPPHNGRRVKTLTLKETCTLKYLERRYDMKIDREYYDYTDYHEAILCMILLGRSLNWTFAIKMLFRGVVLWAVYGDDYKTIHDHYMKGFYRQQRERRIEGEKKRIKEFKERHPEFNSHSNKDIVLLMREENKKLDHKLCIDSHIKEIIEASLCDCEREEWYKITKETDKKIVLFATHWACHMEICIANGDTIEACYNITSQLADREKISESDYQSAVDILSRVWVHGKEFHRALYDRAVAE